MFKKEKVMILNDFSRLIQDVVMSEPAKVQKLSRRLGKKYGTLVREAKPYDTGAKLGAETLLRIMELTGDVRPLEFMADSLGLKLRQRESSASGDKDQGRATRRPSTKRFFQ